MEKRTEHPRPDFVREDWVSLNGEWEFSFDKPVFDQRIQVPFAYQSQMSGIGSAEEHEEVWYRRSFWADGEKLKSRRLLLNFGAVDYEARVRINGKFAGSHRGGHTPFCLDITELAEAGENMLEVYVRDGQETDKPRGKQSWTGEPFGCWYTPTTGIWQSVWLEYAGETYIRRIKLTPDLDRNQALCEVFLSGGGRAEVEVDTAVESADGEGTLPIGKNVFTCENGYGKCALAFPDLDIKRDRIIWSPEHPNLIDVTVRVKRGEWGEDAVHTYFGMRSVSFRGNTFYLNGDVSYQRLVLDQGYWPQSLLTPPDEEAIRRDILLTKEMGFNGVRKHQKIEDPRYYYWADRLGLLVWGELPSSYAYNDNMVRRSVDEMMEFIERDFNHPSLIAWVPVNESWGVRNVKSNRQQQHYCDLMINLIKALDPTRSVSGNDGWEQTGQTDIFAVHDYGLMPETIRKYDDMDAVIGGKAEHRALLADGASYRGQPVLLTEYGGIAFADEGEGWGYYNKVRSEEEFAARLEPVTDFLIKSGKFAGFCYTQLTDVMQEVNGLLREDRTPKVDIKELRRIFGKQYHEA